MMMTLERPNEATMESGFSAWLDEQLEAPGISARQVAIRSGYTPAHLSKLRNGKVGYTRDSVERIAAALCPEDADADERQELLSRALFAAGYVPTDAPEIERLSDDEEALLHLYRGIPSSDMRDAIKQLMRSSVPVTSESGEPLDAGPQGRTT